jgi:hypothetical protein
VFRLTEPTGYVLHRAFGLGPLRIGRAFNHIAFWDRAPSFA